MSHLVLLIPSFSTSLISFLSPPSFFIKDSRPFVHTNAFFESRLQVLRPGAPLRLECLASGTPAPTVQWLLDGRTLKTVNA